jgi:hypothetical protein
VDTAEIGRDTPPIVLNAESVGTDAGTYAQKKIRQKENPK